jgi:heptosyltransferase-2
VLVIQTAFIGDAILGLVVPQALKQLYPDAEVHYLVRKGVESLTAHHPQLAHTWTWDKTQGKYRNLRNLLARVRQHRFGAVVTLQRFAATGLLCGFSGAPLRVGFAKNPISFRFTHRLPHHLGQKGDPNYPHETDRNLSLLQPFGMGHPPAAWRVPRLHPGPQALARVQAMLPAGLFVTFAPASVWATKRWPAEQWVKLGRLITPNMPVVLVGGPADASLCQHIADSLPPGSAINLAGKLSLMESAVAIGRSARLFSNDSSPLHLASAMGTPTTALFLSTLREYGFGPLAPGSRVAQSPEPLPCRPCGLHGHKACPQHHFTCAWGLEPEVVFRDSFEQ